MSNLKLKPDVIKKAGISLSGFNGIDVGFGGLMSGFGGMLFENEKETKNRTVGLFKKNGICVSTVYANDTGYYETGIIDDRYCNDMLIVQEYETREIAERGHKEWVQTLLSEPPVAIKEIQDGEVYIRFGS